MAKKILLIGAGTVGSRVADAVADSDAEIFCTAITETGEQADGLQRIEASPLFTEGGSFEKCARLNASFAKWLPEGAVNGEKAVEYRYQARAGFCDMIGEDRIGWLKNTVRKMFALSNNYAALQTEAKIVASFADTTGSALAALIAFYVRRFFRTEYGREISVTLFALLPKDAERLPEKTLAEIGATYEEIEAYDRIARETEGTSSGCDIPVEGLYDPRAVRVLHEEYARAGYTEYLFRPFNSVCFLREGEGGDRDIRLCASAVRTLAGVDFSLREEAPEAYFHTAGIAKCVYPQKDLLSLGRGKRELAVWNELSAVCIPLAANREKDGSYSFDAAKERELAAQFERDFAELAKNEAFAFLTAETEENGVPRERIYFENLQSYVTESSVACKEYEKADADSQISYKAMKKRALAAEEVLRAERAIDDYYNDIESKTGVAKYTAYSVSADPELYDGGHNLIRLFTAQGNRVHCLSVLKMGYGLLRLAEEKRNGAQTKAAQLRKEYREPVEEWEDSPSELALRMRENSFKSWKAFCADFPEYRDERLQLAHDYGVAKFEAAVYGDMCDSLQSFLRKYAFLLQSGKEYASDLQARLQATEAFYRSEAENAKGVLYPGVEEALAAMQSADIAALRNSAEVNALLYEQITAMPVDTWSEYRADRFAEQIKYLIRQCAERRAALYEDENLHNDIYGVLALVKKEIPDLYRAAEPLAFRGVRNDRWILPENGESNAETEALLAATGCPVTYADIERTEAVLLCTCSGGTVDDLPFAQNAKAALAHTVSRMRETGDGTLTPFLGADWHVQVAKRYEPKAADNSDSE